MDTLFMFIVYIGIISCCLARTKKNVLFIVVDDLRPQLGCYEGKYFPSPVHPPLHSPNIDSLAARSLLLKRAYVQQAVCSPSRTSILTGRRPDTTHVYNKKDYFRNVGGNFTTIPEYFKSKGYISVGMGKIFHHGDASGNDDPQSWSVPYFHASKNGLESVNQSWRAIPDSELQDRPLVDYQINENAKQTLKSFSDGEENEGKPFFIAVGFHKPHLPFVFPESFLNFYPQDSIKLPPNAYAPVNMPSVAWNRYGDLLNYGDIKDLGASGNINTNLPNSTVLELRRAYYSSVTWVDSLVGSLLNTLDELGFKDKTIVSLFGDHGFQLGEHGTWAKQTNFEIATHAPMMLHIPGITDSGIVSDKLTEFVDVFPTLVEAAGLDQLPLCPTDSTSVTLCREGTSLIPLTKDTTTTWKTAAFSQYPRRRDGLKVMGYTVKTELYRYTEWPSFTYGPDYKPNWDDLHGTELYDHIIDPQENINRADDPAYGNVTDKLKKILRAGWRDIIPVISDGPTSSVNVPAPIFTTLFATSVIALLVSGV